MLASKLIPRGVYMSRHLSFISVRKAAGGKARVRTGLGSLFKANAANPTVRDERGACGNVGYGGTRNPSHIPKGCVSETLCLRLRALYFYPTTRDTIIKQPW